MYRIGEFSKIVKITVKTLRFYDEIGLLKPSFTDKFTNYRYYTTEQLYPLQQILAFKQAGFSIEEIKYVLSGKNIEKLLNEKETVLKQEHAYAEEKLLRLTSIKKNYLEKRTMDYQAIIKQLPEYIVYYKQFVAKNYTDYGSIIPKIGMAISKANPDLKCVKPSFCYVEGLDGEYKEENVRAEYVEAVEKVGIEVDGIKFKKLPKTIVAAVMLKGSYENISSVYAYLVSWIEINGYEIAGNGREQYIDGCWNKDTPDEYLTEIQIPIEKKV